MLVTLCDYKQSVTLIANSGVQFLDFGLTPQDTASNGRFVRKTANGPLLRLDFDLVNGRYTLPASGGSQPEVVKPESTIPLQQSLTVLDGVWLPLPFLRFNPPRTFVDGPDNWARVQVRKLDTPDAAGNTHRVTLALDSQIAEHATSALSPVSPSPGAMRKWRTSSIRPGLTAGCAKPLPSLRTALKNALSASCTRQCAALNIRRTGSISCRCSASS